MGTPEQISMIKVANHHIFPSSLKIGNFKKTWKGDLNFINSENLAASPCAR